MHGLDPGCTTQSSYSTGRQLNASRMSTETPASGRAPVRPRQSGRQSHLSGDRLIYGAVVAAVAVGYFLCFRSSVVLPTVDKDSIVGGDEGVQLRSPGWTTQHGQESSEEVASPAPQLASTPLTVEIPEDEIKDEIPVPSNDDFENDEEVKQIKREMREEVQSQATELGASKFIAEEEWQNHVTETEIQSRGKAAVMGGYLADAASLGLQGVAGTEAVKKLIQRKKRKTPEFFTPPVTPYQAEPGSFSAWGYEVLPLLQALLGANKMDGAHFSTVSYEYFKKYPGHINDVPKNFVARIEGGKPWPYCGINSDAASSLIKVPVIVARYAGTPELAEMVGDAVRVHQSNFAAVSAALVFAGILERAIVLNSTVQEAAVWAMTSRSVDDAGRAWVKDVVDNSHLSLQGAVQRWGDGSSVAEVLQLSLHVALSKASYVQAVRDNIFLGGDSTARAHVVGALLGARDGYDAIPKRWKSKAIRRLQLEQMVHMLLYQRTAKVPIALEGGA